MNGRDQWLATERLKSIADAETYLTNFCREWPLYAFEDLPGLVKVAMGNLVVLTLADPVRAGVRLLDVAWIANLPIEAVQTQVAERVEFFRTLTATLDDESTRDQALLDWERMIVE
jgi:hypothetical protein